MMRVAVRQDSGFALVAVIGAMVVITIVALTGWAMSSQALRTAENASYENRAFQAANTGLDRVMNSGRANAAPVKGTLSNGDSYEVTFAPDGTTPTGMDYIITSVGRSGPARETLVVRLWQFDLWNMNVGAGMAGGMSSGAGWNGNATIRGAFYTKGDMNWLNGNAVFEEGPLFIKDGALLCGASATVGLEQPIYLYATNGIGQGSKLSNIYLANNPPGTSVPDLPLHWIDQAKMKAMADKAKAESCNNLMDGGRIEEDYDKWPNAEATTLGSPSYPGTPAIAGVTYYKYLVPGGGAMTGGNPLTIGGSSFGRWQYDIDPGPDVSLADDDFAYDKTTRTLYVNGVVVVDGNLSLNNISEYRGNGVIYVNGNVDINTDLLPRGGSISAQNCLGIASTGEVHLDSRMNGAVFCNGKFWLEGTQAWFKGTVLAGAIDASHPNCTLITDPALPEAVPKGMPDAEAKFQLIGTVSRR